MQVEVEDNHVIILKADELFSSLPFRELFREPLAYLAGVARLQECIYLVFELMLLFLSALD
jgi:hypothetical protein